MTECMQKKQNMVIHCASGINNSGDEAILSVLLKRYEKRFNITVICVNKENTLKYNPNIKCYNDGDSCCKKIVENCDAFILGGGGLLQDETSIYNIYRWLRYLKIAVNNNKFTMLYANSIGPLNHKSTRNVVKKTLLKVTLITLRDEVSRDLLKEIGVTKNVYTTCDLAFSMQEEMSEQDFLNFKEKYSLPNRYICVAIRHWYDIIPFIPVSICTKLNIRTKKNTALYERYISELGKIVDYCNEVLNLPVVFVSFLVGRDDRVASDIIRRCHIKNNIIISDQDILPQGILSLISHSEFVLGMRLHSIIYAIVTETPFIVIDYSQKVNGLIAKFKMEKVKMCIDNFSVEKFMEIIYSVDFHSMVDELKSLKEQGKNEERINDELFTKYYLNALTQK